MNGGGSLADWDDSFAFVVGNEVSGDRLWQGSVRFLSVHNRALTDAQIQQNFDAGVGEKFFLLFSVAHLIDVPDSYVLFQVSQFDEFSYLFESPQFISLDPAASPDNVPLQGMRIGINGAEIGSSQAYSNLNVLLNDTDFVDSSQPLSRLGTLVPLQKGPESDSFFLTFELLGDNVNAFTEPAPLQPGTPPDVERDPAVGLRTFDEINASMSVITGISQANASVTATYQTIKQQLPSVENIQGFLASHQVAIAQLSIEYCNELVNTPASRSAFYPGFDFDAPASTAFANATSRDLLIDPMLNNMFGTTLDTQPDIELARTELNALIDRLTACGNSCSSDRTAIVAKATCAAMLGNAAVLIH
jgi:hypothetical protein